MIDSEAMKAWLTYPTTQAVFKELRADRDAISNALLDGSTLDLSSAESTGMRTSFLLGRIKGLNTLLNMTVEGEDDQVS
jgi:hypothetical protein